MRTIACEIAERMAPSIAGVGSDVSGRTFSPRAEREAASSMPPSSPQIRARNRTGGSGALEADRVARLGMPRRRRVAEQDPLAVGTLLQLAAGNQLAERRRHGRAAGADHPGKRPVREAQRHEDALRHYAAPALGQAPEQRQQAVVDA